MIWSRWEIKENCHVLVKQFQGNFHNKTPSCRENRSVYSDVKWCFNASWGLKGLMSEFCSEYHRPNTTHWTNAGFFFLLTFTYLFVLHSFICGFLGAIIVVLTSPVVLLVIIYIYEGHWLQRNCLAYILQGNGNILYLVPSQLQHYIIPSTH